MACHTLGGRLLDDRPRVGPLLEPHALIAACSSFTSAIGRAIDRLRGHQLHEREKDAVRQQIAKVRATADWLESAVDTGNLSLDEGLAALLCGE